MGNPRVSVALCTYNGEQFVGEQLESFVRQSRLPDELIVCDDGSVDMTAEIVASFSRSAPFPVKWTVNGKNLGSSKNFERAIGLCTGDIIFLSDQDDVWRKDKIELLTKCLTTDPGVGVVFSDAEIVDKCLGSLGYRMWDEIKFDETERRTMNVRGRAVQVLLKHNVVTGATMAFRAAYVPLVCPIPEGWVHDSWISLLIACVAELRAVPEALILYRQHGANQIGGLHVTRADRIERVRAAGAMGAEAHLREAGEQYLLVKERLRQAMMGNGPIALVDDKIAHLESRLRIYGDWYHGLFVCLSELVQLRYHRYSAGWQSLFKDLSQAVFRIP